MKENSLMMGILTFLMAYIIVVGFLAWGIYDYLSMPVVEMSWSTKACVSVDPEPFTCESLPDRYETVWVK